MKWYVKQARRRFAVLEDRIDVIESEIVDLSSTLTETMEALGSVIEGSREHARGSARLLDTVKNHQRLLARIVKRLP